MRVFVLSLLALCAPVSASEFYIDWQAAYSPPGGDIVVGNKIGRYVLDIKPTIEHGYFQFSVLARAYGLQTWVPPEERGHGLDKFKGSYAWSAEEWRFALAPRLQIGTEKIHFFIENYAPVDRHGVWDSDGGHGQATEYYWLLGAAGRIRF